MVQNYRTRLLFVFFAFAFWGCAPQNPPSYEDLNIRFSNVHTNGKCDTARSLEIWVTQVYSYYDNIQTIRDQFDAIGKDTTDFNDLSSFLETVRSDFNRLMPPECAAQSYYFAYYALYLASDFLSNPSTKTTDDAKFIVYLLDVFLSDQQDIEAQYEAMFDQ